MRLTVLGGMSNLAWRRLLLTLCAITLVLTGVDLWMSSNASDIGATPQAADPYSFPGTATTVPFITRVTVLPGSPAGRAGLRTGDFVDARHLSAPDRFRWYTSTWPVGARVQLLVLRGAVTRRLSVVVEASPITWQSWLNVVAVIWLLLFAAVIAWRRPDSAEARTLALLLVLNTFGAAFYPGNWVTPWPAIDAVLAAFGHTIFLAGIALLATYAMLFVRPPTFSRRVLASLTYGAACIGALYAVVYVAGVWTLTADPAQAWYAGTLPQLVAGPLIFSLPVLCALVTFAQARGAERARIAWVTVSLAPFYLGTAVYGALAAFDHELNIPALSFLFNESLFLAPLGLTYALLNRQILGVGFALSRAAVFSAVSLLVVGAFVLAEWLAGLWFSAANSTANLAITAAIAAGLALSLRFLYTRIDALLDAVLFRRQRQARALVARMIAGLPYAESAESIAGVVVRGVCESFGLTSGALFRRRQEGGYERAASHGWSPGQQIAPPDLQRLSVALEGAPSLLALSNFPFEYLESMPRANAGPIVGVPLYVRRQLAGFVLYSGHADGTALDPEERALLVELGAAASRGYDALELAARVEVSYQARVEAETEAKETLRRSNAVLERLNEAYVRYVPSEFLQLLNKQSIVDVALGDSVQQKMTVLFSDIRSFATLCEGMSPPEIFALLNRYLHEAGPLIREHSGFIDKYIGDAIMGLFPKRADDALQAGIALQREIRLLNAKLADEDLPQIAIGVGLHTGELMLGTIGERGRMETTVIADAVNVASRLESATKTFGCSIVLSRETRDALSEPNRFMLRPLGSVLVKGKTRGVDIYECYDADPADLAMHKRATHERFADAVAAYEDKDPVASELFAAILAANEKDGAAAYFLGWCSQRATNV